MTSARITVPGVLGVVTMGLFDLAYTLVTPCNLTLAPESHSVLWTFGGCSFQMQVNGLIVTAVGALVGFGIGWMIRNRLMGHR